MTDLRRIRQISGFIVAALTAALPLDARAEAGSDFELVDSYVHRQSNLELMLPYRFEVRAGERDGELFQAWGATRYPSISVTLIPSSASTDDCLHRMLERFGTSARIVSETEESLQGERATVGFIRWAAPIGAGVELQSMVLCVRTGEEMVAVSATDGAPNTGFDERLAHTVRSLRFNPTSASKPSR